MNEKLRKELVDNFKSDFIDGAEWMYNKVKFTKKELLIEYCEYVFDECSDGDRDSVDSFLKDKL